MFGDIDFIYYVFYCLFMFVLFRVKVVANGCYKNSSRLRILFPSRYKKTEQAITLKFTIIFG